MPRVVRCRCAHPSETHCEQGTLLSAALPGCDSWMPAHRCILLNSWPADSRLNLPAAVRVRISLLFFWFLFLRSTCSYLSAVRYGYSDKPDPRAAPRNSIYNFENWGQQCVDFISEVIGSPAVISTNSVGGLAGLAAAIAAPKLVTGVQVTHLSSAHCNMHLNVFLDTDFSPSPSAFVSLVLLTAAADRISLCGRHVASTRNTFRMFHLVTDDR